MTPKQAALRILELDKEATPGPWLVDCEADWPRVIQINHLTRDVWEIVESGNHYGTTTATKVIEDINLISESRTIAPQIAKSLLEAIELLKQCLKEESHRADQLLRTRLVNFLKQHGDE